MYVTNQPFKLEGTFNTRELGGYVNKNQQVLKNRKLIRSDILSNLTNDDMEELYQYGVRTVIDLRRKTEVMGEPSKLENYRDIKYHNVSLSTNDGGLMQERTIESLAELYQSYVTERQGQLKEILELVSENLSDGAVIFNCTAGKDRTGMISMLLLKICDVDDDIIIKDYEVSEKHIFDYLQERHRDADNEIPSFLYGSPRSEMEKTLHFIQANYGSVRQYLQEIQVDDGVLEKIRTALLG